MESLTAQNLDKLAVSKSKLTERDLIRICVENPKYLSKTLGHGENEGTGLQSVEQKKEFLKYMYRAWSGMTKYLF